MYICGIDVAKYQHAVQIMNGEGQIQRKVFSVNNTAAGFAELLEVLKSLEGVVTVGLEATGHYLLACKGHLEAIKRGRIWYTTRWAVVAYRQSVES